MRYHPRIGYTYMPGAKLRVQGATGGYLVRTNAAGFRSEREFVPARSPGSFRVLLFGDSQTAGDGSANGARFSDLIEKAVPGLEIYNYGLSGSGTDQQYLAYDEHCAVEHDLVVICVYTENIRRLSRRIVRSQDMNGEIVFRAKPYFELEQDRLTLCGVPVPKQSWSEETLPKELLPHVYTYGEEYSVFREPGSGAVSLLKKLAPAGPVRDAMKSLMGLYRKFQPLPEYDTPETPSWKLLRSLLTTWVHASRAPVLIVPLPHETALRRESDATNAQVRFRELSRETGCALFDPLPALMGLDDETRIGLWSAASGHLSVAGHSTLARLLEPEIRRFMSATGAAS